MPEDADNLWEDLVLSILAVNQYSLERTYRAASGLRSQGLFQPEKLADWSPEEIARRLRCGDCDRGDFMTGLFARRLFSLGQFVQSAGVSEVERVLRVGTPSDVKQLLLRVNGIGPKVLANFFLLRRRPAS